MSDWFSFAGGVAFLILASMSFFRRDLLFRLYSFERRWRERNPEHTPAFDAQAKRYGVAFIVIGIIFIGIGIVGIS